MVDYKIQQKTDFIFVFQSDDASAVQNALESPVDTDPAEATEVNAHTYMDAHTHTQTNTPPAVKLHCLSSTR